MENLFDQVLKLLASPTGSLVYSLIIAFSIMGALQVTLSLQRASSSGSGKVILSGFGFLLVLLVAALIFDVFVLQGYAVAQPYSPLLERMIVAFGLIIVMRMWGFPDKHGFGNAVRFLLLATTIAFTTYSYLYWDYFVVDGFFNTTVLDLGWSTLSAIVAFLGFLFLTFRKPHAWGYGALFFLLILSGEIFHLLLPSQQGDIPAVVRLAQLCAYPLLFALPSLIVTLSRSSDIVLPKNISLRVHKFGVEPATLEKLNDFMTSVSLIDTEKALLNTAVKAMNAELALLIHLPEIGEQPLVDMVFDSTTKKINTSLPLDREIMHPLINALAQKRSFRAYTENSLELLMHLATALEINTLDSVIAAPIIDGRGRPVSGIVILSPKSQYTWTKSEQQYLELLASALSNKMTTHTVQVSSDVSVNLLEEELRDAKAALFQAEESLAQASSEPKIIVQERPSVEDAQIPILRDKIQVANAKITDLNGQLNKANAQIDTLKSIEPQRIETHTISTEAQELAQELRQPAASISSYADILLNEAVSTLNVTQEGFIKRIKDTAERLQKQLNLAINYETIDPYTPAPEYATVKSTNENHDLWSVIQESLETTNKLKEEKGISLILNLPENSPRVQINKEQLSDLVSNLVKHSIVVTPNGGTTQLRVDAIIDNSNSKLLFQAANQGVGGTTEEHVAELITKGEPLGATGTFLGTTSSLTKQMNGKLWVRANPGVGSTINIEIPLTDGISPYA